MAAAESAAQDALQVHSLSAELHALHSTVLTHLKQGPAAVEAARRAVYLDRSFVMAHIALADALLLVDARAEAARALRNARRQLSALAPESIVRGSDEEPAERLAVAVDMRLHFLEETG